MAILPNSNNTHKFIIKKAKKNKIKNILTFGSSTSSILKIKRIIKINKNYLELNLIYKQKNINIIINKNQILRVDNILVCLLIFIYNKIKIDNFSNLSKHIPLIEGRGIKYKIKIFNKKIHFIDDSYNASPHTMQNCIKTFSEILIVKNQKKFLILGEMKELGKNEIDFHTELLVLITQKRLENVIICGELFELALKKVNNKNILFMSDIKTILNYIKIKISNNDIIFIKGSNSSLTNKLTFDLLKKENK